MSFPAHEARRIASSPPSRGRSCQEDSGQLAPSPPQGGKLRRSRASFQRSHVGGRASGRTIAPTASPSARCSAAKCRCRLCSRASGDFRASSCRKAYCRAINRSRAPPLRQERESRGPKLGFGKLPASATTASAAVALGFIVRIVTCEFERQGGESWATLGKFVSPWQMCATGTECSVFLSLQMQPQLISKFVGGREGKAGAHQHVAVAVCLTHAPLQAAGKETGFGQICRGATARQP